MAPPIAIMPSWPVVSWRESRSPCSMLPTRRRRRVGGRRVGGGSVVFIGNAGAARRMEDTEQTDRRRARILQAVDDARGKIDAGTGTELGHRTLATEMEDPLAFEDVDAFFVRVAVKRALCWSESIPRTASPAGSRGRCGRGTERLGRGRRESVPARPRARGERGRARAPRGTGCSTICRAGSSGQQALTMRSVSGPGFSTLYREPGGTKTPSARAERVLEPLEMAGAGAARRRTDTSSAVGFTITGDDPGAYSLMAWVMSAAPVSRDMSGAGRPGSDGCRASPSSAAYTRHPPASTFMSGPSGRCCP